VVAFTVEKFFQTYIKLLLVLVVFPLFYPEHRIWLWLFAGAAMLLYFFLPALWGQKFMERFREKELDYKRIFLQTLAYSLVIYFCLILQYYILLNDANSISLLNTGLTVTMIWGSGLLPISVAGLGVRENLAAFFLANYGIPPYTAVGIALLIFVFNTIVPALIGLTFIYQRRQELKTAGGTIKSTTQKIYQHGRERLKRKKNGNDQ
jgi:uncharacterized membrane protein YbhN (UPF0104 family)